MAIAQLQDPAGQLDGVVDDGQGLGVSRLREALGASAQTVGARSDAGLIPRPGLAVPGQHRQHPPGQAGQGERGAGSRSQRRRSEGQDAVVIAGQQVLGASAAQARLVEQPERGTGQPPHHDEVERNGGGHARQQIVAHEAGQRRQRARGRR